MRLGHFIGPSSVNRVKRAYDGFKQVIAINYLTELIAERKLELSGVVLTCNLHLNRLEHDSRCDSQNADKAR